MSGRLHPPEPAPSARAASAAGAPGAAADTEAAAGRSRRLLFLDVDGVLLDFDAPFHAALLRCGVVDPGPLEAWRERRYFYSYEMFPDRMTRELSKRLLLEVCASGALRTQRVLPGVSRADTRLLLARQNVLLLTSIPPAYAPDRAAGLCRAFALPDAGALSSRLLCSWGEEKAAVVARACAERGVAVEDGVLVDDCPANVAGVLSLGATGLLVAQPYNAWARSALEERHGARYALVPHDRLAAACLALASAGGRVRR